MTKGKSVIMNSINLMGKLIRKSEQVGMSKQVTFITVLCRHRQYTEYIDVICFGQKASLINAHFTEGDWIGIQGYLHNNRRPDGTYKLEVVADEVHFVGDKPKKPDYSGIDFMEVKP